MTPTADFRRWAAIGVLAIVAFAGAFLAGRALLDQSDERPVGRVGQGDDRIAELPSAKQLARGPETPDLIAPERSERAGPANEAPPASSEAEQTVSPEPANAPVEATPEVATGSPAPVPAGSTVEPAPPQAADEPAPQSGETRFGFDDSG
jgi:hypothetical protein